VFHVCARSLYAALGEEHNRNRRLAESDAVTRKLMTLDFVLAHPNARFWATEADKVLLLQERSVPHALWPSHVYAAKRHTGMRPTTRYFVDKMPWYRQAEDSRLWIAYVDADVTLRGFETFLGQYRGLLSAVPSGVTYVGAAAWPGAVQRVFDKVIVVGEAGSHGLGNFLDYCRLRRCVEAREFAAQVADRHEPRHRAHTARRDHPRKRKEPCAFPKRRKHSKRPRVASFVPNPVVVRGNDLEMIFAGRELRIRG